MSLSRMLPRAAAVLAAALLLTAAAPEPEELWTGPMLSETPATLAGARVIDVEALERLMAEKPLLIDSGPADKKPDTLPATAIWKPRHRSIPGAVWFPGAGRGDLDTARADALMQRIAELSQGDTSRPIVSFCQPGCWGSWNVGKRLVAAGYTAVHWFPAGINAWQERGETALVEPQPGWEAKPAAAN